MNYRLEMAPPLDTPAATNEAPKKATASVTAPLIETPVATTAASKKAAPAVRAPLNERILSSMSRRPVAAHPWHDLEIGTRIIFKQYSITVF